MAKPTYCPRCSRMHDILFMECPPADEPISEAALAELEGLAQKMRRTNMIAPGPLAKLACDEVPRLIAEVRRLNRRNNELIEKLAKLAESEPWPEGPVPPEVLAVSASLTYEQIVEATVKATRESIAKKIRAISSSPLDPQKDCDHEWSHIEDHHVYCPKCKKTADLCFTCEAEKQDVGGKLVCLNCRGH